MAQVGQLTSLRELDVSHNLLKALPPAVGQCTALQSLRASSERPPPPALTEYNAFRIADAKQRAPSTGNITHSSKWGCRGSDSR